MPQRIVVVPTNHGAGVTSVCLGLAHALGSRGVSVGYVKPFAQVRTVGEDSSAELVRLATSLRPPPPISFTRVEEALASGDDEELMEEVVALAADSVGNHQVVVVEGLPSDLQQVHATRLNAETVRALDADVLLVASAADSSPERVAHQLAAMSRHYRIRGGTRVLGAVVNRIPEDENDGRYERAVAEAGFTVVASLTRRPDFVRPRVLDLVRQLGFEVLNTGEDHRRVGGTAVIAQSLPGFLSALTDDRLVLVPGDRHEVLLAAALAEQSGIRLAAIVLTAGVRPDPEVLAICGPALRSGLPVLFTPEPTFETATRVIGLDLDVPADDEERARLVMCGVSRAFDASWLDALPRRERVQRVTPAAFRLASVTEAARADVRIAVTDADDPRVLAAAIALSDRGILRPVLVGDPARIEQTAVRTDLELPQTVRIVDAARLDAGEHERLRERLAAIAARVPAVSGLEPADPLVRGLDLVARGEVDGLVTGLSGGHDDIFALAPEFVGLRSDASMLTSAHVLNFPDEVVVYSDCRLHEHPDAEELTTIALSAATAAEGVGLQPRVAIVTGGPGRRADEEAATVARVVELVRERRPDLHVEGPVTLSAGAGRPESGRPGGDASVLVFADLATANATYRAETRAAGVTSYGPLLLGLARPVNVVAPEAGAAEISDRMVGTARQAALLL